MDSSEDASRPEISDKVKEWIELEELLRSVGSDFRLTYGSQSPIAVRYLVPADEMLDHNELDEALSLFVCLAVDHGATESQLQNMISLAKRMEADAYAEILELLQGS